MIAFTLQMDTLHSFSGKVVVIDTWNDSEAELEEKHAAAESTFASAAVVALDLEWTPDFETPGDDGGNPVALIQLAVPDQVVLIRTPPGYTLPPWLKILLLSESVTKITVGFDYCDKAKLLASFDLHIPKKSVCDLCDLARNCGVAQRGFKSLCFYFDYHPRKSRRISMSQWGSPERLSPAQTTYAAEDAWFCLLIAARLNDTSTESLDMFLVTGKFEKNEEPKFLGKRKRSLSAQLFLPIGEEKLSLAALGNLTRSVVDEFFEIHPVGTWIPEPTVLIALLGSVAGNSNPVDAASWAALRDKLHATALVDVSWDGEALYSIYRLKNHSRASSAARIRARLEPVFSDHTFLTEELLVGAEHIAAGSKDEDDFFYSAVAKMKESIDLSTRGISDLKNYRKKHLSKFIRNLRVNTNS